MSSKKNLVYITAGSLEEARAIGKELVSKRLAACVNIIDKMNSIYWWDGEIQDEKEVIIIAKTRESLVTQLIDVVKSLHTYVCPCILSMEIIDGYKPFLDWIGEETKETRTT